MYVCMYVCVCMDYMFYAPLHVVHTNIAKLFKMIMVQENLNYCIDWLHPYSAVCIPKRQNKHKDIHVFQKGATTFNIPGHSS
jgi:hypothetical protein